MTSTGPLRGSWTRAVPTAVVGLVVLLAGCGTGPAPPTTAPPSVGRSVTPSALATTSSHATSGPTTATAARTGVPPPFVSAATWVRGSGGRSLHVVPTAAGRVAQGAGDAAEAWSEVVRLAPDADQPGMQTQFDCHWTYARLVQPDKPSWNLEPWRPVVSDAQMVDARCNPGGPEAADG